jgi:GTP-binding protein
VDISADNAYETYLQTNEELKKWSVFKEARDASEIPQIIALNKIDDSVDEYVDEFLSNIGIESGIHVFTISAAARKGLDELVKGAANKLEELPPIKHWESQPEPEIEYEERITEVYRDEDGVFVVEADWIEPVMRNANPNDYESMQYFQRVLQKSGINGKLIAAGVRDGDTVSVCGYEFDYVE